MKKERKGASGDKVADSLKDLPDMPKLSSDEEAERIALKERKEGIYKKKKEMAKLREKRKRLREEGTLYPTDESEVDEL
jgi:hypothetical protein